MQAVSFPPKINPNIVVRFTVMLSGCIPMWRGRKVLGSFWGQLIGKWVVRAASRIIRRPECRELLY